MLFEPPSKNAPQVSKAAKRSLKDKSLYQSHKKTKAQNF
jgi:hypothetical protein